MESIAKNVSDMPEATRQSLEQLIGRHLAANQQVFIMAVDPLAAPREPTRQQRAAGIHQIIAEAQAHADAEGVTEAEADAAVDEAMTHVRRRA